MFDGILDVLGDIGDTIGNVFDVVSDTNWTEVLSSSIMPSLVGAGIGALASAVTDGDITDGLLYGAAGGLVSGGLLNFGSQFASNWSASSNPTGWVDTANVMGEAGGFLESDLPVLEESGVSVVPDLTSAEGIAEATRNTLNPSTGGGWWQNTKELLMSEGGASLALGGAKFIGDLLDDSPTEAELLQEKMDREQQRLDDRKTALASFDTTTGAYVPSTSVYETIRTRGLEDATKEDMGVNLGGNTNV